MGWSRSSSPKSTNYKSTFNLEVLTVWATLDWVVAQRELVGSQVWSWRFGLVQQTGRPLVKMVVKIKVWGPTRGCCPPAQVHLLLILWKDGKVPHLVMGFSTSSSLFLVSNSKWPRNVCKVHRPAQGTSIVNKVTVISEKATVWSSGRDPAQQGGKEWVTILWKVNMKTFAALMTDPVLECSSGLVVKHWSDWHHCLHSAVLCQEHSWAPAVCGFPVGAPLPPTIEMLCKQT